MQPPLTSLSLASLGPPLLSSATAPEKITAEAGHGDLTELARKTQDPTSEIITIPLQSNLTGCASRKNPAWFRSRNPRGLRASRDTSLRPGITASVIRRIKS